MTLGKSISDPVHGTIDLSEVEARVISTRAFQRLRHVKQLGLAYMVFPAADYSRFSHSLGVCHITRQTIGALRNRGVSIDEREEQLYCLAGLLHDVGHYPFSHAMEEALKIFFAKKIVEDNPEGGKKSSGYLNHEEVGKEVLRVNEELSAVLTNSGFTPEEIYQVFTRESPPRFANLISSDLDADRCDYLLRTAHHTGLTYAKVDLPYLLRNLHVDSNEHICLHPKALKTADHFLLGRYFDYQQVPFHKTVAGLEWVLEDTINTLLDEGVVACDEESIRDRIQSNEWESFDDMQLMQHIRELAATTKDDVVRWKAESIVYRRPPHAVFLHEVLGGPDEKRVLNLKKKFVEANIAKWANGFGVDQRLWKLWSVTSKLTKVGSRVPTSALTSNGAGVVDLDEAMQAIRILDPATNQSSPIMENRRSLMSVLADNALYMLRVFVVLPPTAPATLRADIENHIRTELSVFN